MCVLYTEKKNKDKTQTIVVDLSGISLIKKKNGLEVSIRMHTEKKEQNTDLDFFEHRHQSHHCRKKKETLTHL